VHAAGFNLGLVMRQMLGVVGKPKHLQGPRAPFWALWRTIWTLSALSSPWDALASIFSGRIDRLRLTRHSYAAA